MDFNPLPPSGGRPVGGNTVKMQIADFNPLPPSGGRRVVVMRRKLKKFKFQSTPSKWRETLEESENHVINLISIHSLQVEGD